MSMLGRKHNLSEETKQKATNSLNRFVTFIDVHDIVFKSIDRKRVVEYVAHLGEEYAHGTISARLSRLKSIWTHAYQMGEVSKKDEPFEGLDLSPYKLRKNGNRLLGKNAELLPSKKCSAFTRQIFEGGVGLEQSITITVMFLSGFMCSNFSVKSLDVSIFVGLSKT